MNVFKNHLIEEPHFSKIYFWIISLQLIAAASISFFILLFLKVLPAKLPFFYSLPWGEKQLANHQQLFILPALLVLIALINIIISHQLHPTLIFFKKILIYSSLITSLILTITFIKIVLIFI